MNLLTSLRTLILALILSIGISYAYAAWSPPGAAQNPPPSGNIDAPVNVGAGSQTKTGPLWANGIFSSAGGYVVGNLEVVGNVGIGTPSPSAKLEVVSGSCYYRFQIDGLHTNCTVGNPGTAISITADTVNYNLATALGNPTTPTNVTLTINSGVTVYSNTTPEAALDTGILPPGSSVTIVNTR